MIKFLCPSVLEKKNWHPKQHYMYFESLAFYK